MNKTKAVGAVTTCTSKSGATLHVRAHASVCVFRWPGLLPQGRAPAEQQHFALVPLDVHGLLLQQHQQRESDVGFDLQGKAIPGGVRHSGGGLAGL